MLDYTHFRVLYNKSKKLPFYTAVNIDGSTHLMGMEQEERPSAIWLPNNRIGTARESFQYGDADYAGSGFQKGRLLRYFDAAWESRHKCENGSKTNLQTPAPKAPESI